ncbi:MAG: GNAT family protein [Anaerolineaceae bacterium]|nr:GNAT family protein [Anaerolineaceae bacterium]
MNPRPLLQGESIRLVAIDPETDAEAWSLWSHDSQYNRLLAHEPLHPRTAGQLRIEMEKEETRNDSYPFAIHTLEGDQLIGFIAIEGIFWPHGAAWVSIGIGERDFRGKGYGTDAMREALRFAFTEVNLFRISLDVFEYNLPGIRSYEKAGFVHEGRIREGLKRDGRYWDVLYMGILREEWQKLQVPGG